jgi:myxalamid-type polyketide synthase MxaE and MxaD
LRPLDIPANAVPDDDAPPPSGLSSMQRAILTIQRMRTRIEAFERTKAEPIAIIGMACRFPGGADTPEAFFRLLEEGMDAITEVPAERWPISDAPSTDPEARAVRWGAFLQGVDLFDAHFFGISPREAAKMDPQQRLLLEVTWEALESGGQVPDQLVGSRTGVFLGIMNNDYAELSALAGIEQEDAYTTTGNGHCFPAGRLSYTFGFQGPSVAVDTACSSSLVAVHLACQSLRNGESSMALAGGVNLMLAASTTRRYARTQALSPDGRCRAFDASANGFVRGEGCGMVVLKRLSDAERDGDPILAVIRGSAVNQDGRSTGLTTPNVLAQEAMLAQALESARVSASEIGYVETHGTGTPLGDPIEVEALKAVLGAPREDKLPCVLGAVKTNVGHLEAAAGVAGLIKAALVLQRGMIPRNNHFRTLNPRIRFDGTPFMIPKANMPWKAGDKRRVGSVSSFAMSGTNAHLIVEEWPHTEEEDLTADASAYLLPISARSQEALEALAAAYAQHLSTPDSGPRLRDVVHTASVRRSHHPYRLTVAGGSRQEMADALEAFGRGETPASVMQGQASNSPAKVVFVFSGQGSQWLGMGRQLMKEEPVFRSTIENCDARLSSRVGWSLIDELTASESQSRLAETEVAQPAIFAIQVALAELLRSWGIVPDAVIGHSIGEIAAAHVAGILTLDDAVSLVGYRGRIMQRATGLGKMVSVALPESEAQQAIAGREARMSIAAINDPGSVVLSGEEAAVDAVVATLSGRGVECRPLRVNYAFHSPRMDRLQHDLVEALGRISARRASIAMYSTVTAECVEGEELRAEYWGKNMRQPVRLMGAVDAALRDGYRFFLEIGPHGVLASNIAQCLAARQVEGVVAHSMRRKQDERRSLLDAVGALYTHGCPVVWGSLYSPGGRVVPLPAYPWQRERYWVAATRQRTAARLAQDESAHPLLGASLTSSLDPRARFWEQRLGLQAQPWLRECLVRGEVVFPGTAWVEMALAAAIEQLGEGPRVLDDVSFERTLTIPSGQDLRVQLALVSEDGGRASFQIASASGGHDWVRHATGRIGPLFTPAGPLESPQAVRKRCRTTMTGIAHHENMERRGVLMGAAFQGLEQVWLGDGEAVGLVGRTEGVAAQGHFHEVPPAHLNACFQVLFGLLASGAPEDVYALASIERVRWYRSFGEKTWAIARLRPTEELDARVADLTLISSDGAVCAVLEGVKVERLHARQAVERDVLDDCTFVVEWRVKERAPERVEARSGTGVWLVLRDGTGTGAGLAALLRARGDACVEVVAGEWYERLEPSVYRINPTSASDYRRLLQEAFDKDRPCRGVVHLWSLDSAPPGRTTAATLAADQDRSLGSALLLTQALLRQAFRDAPRFVLVTRGAQAVGEGAAPVSIAQAPLWGFGRTLALEHAALECARVDLDPAFDPNEREHLLRELFAIDREDQIALRGRHRHAARIVRSALAAAPSKAVSLRGDATYLVTGGLGGLGLSVARWMVAQGARHIALLGRSSPSTAAREAMSAMEAAGAEVLVLSADLSREADVKCALESVRRWGPPLGGVVHAAGVVDDRTLLELSREQIHRVLAPKVQGTWSLHEGTLGDALDFFVMYSSAASVLGSPGQANYAAANAFMDALAHARHGLGLPATSIHWGPFSEVGMAAAQENRGSRLSNRGLGSITPEEGARALGILLSHPRAEVAVMRLEPRQWMEFYPQAAGVPFFGELAKERGKAKAMSARAGRFRETLDRATPGDKPRLLAEHVLSHIAKVLQLDPARIARSASFTSLGIDSLMGLEIRDCLETSLGVKLAATVLFTYASPGALVEHIAAQLMPAPVSKPEPVVVAAEHSLPAMFLARDEAAVRLPADDDDLLSAFDQSLREIQEQKLR